MISIYVNASGSFIGMFDGEHNAPEGATQVLVAPEDARQVWDFETGQWGGIPGTVPEVIDALDGLLTLGDAGLGDAYQAWADDPARTFTERAFIDKAMRWKRGDPTVLTAATALGLTAGQVDALFIAASARG